MLLLGLLPVALRRPLAGALARTWWYACPIRKQTVLSNLARAFPERDAAWRRDTAIRCMRHFIWMLLESREGGARDEAYYRSKVCEVAGEENLLRAREAGRGAVIGITAHLGNWELFGAYQAVVKKDKVAVLAKPMHNPLANRRITEAREKTGMRVIQFSRNMRPVLKAIQEKYLVGFLADQDARRNGIFVPFFGEPASTFTGPALFAHHCDVPFFMATCVRVGDGERYRIRFYPPVAPDPKADRDVDIERLTRIHVKLLEEAIRECPEQYFWFHKRWKSRPKTKKIA